jgi:hypothetical protein
VAQRIRTAKTLAQRIDLSYFKRQHPLRHWRFIASMVVPLAAIVWIAGMAAAGSRAPFSSGPLAAAHHMFTNRCERCHVAEAGAFSAAVTDNACRSCHVAPDHRSNEAFTPSCANCHAEHRGPVRLAATSDASCTQCHAALTTKSVEPKIATNVGPFATGHPAFAAHRNAVRDETALRFNHAVHMKENLRGAGGDVTLSCSTCHKPNGPSPRGSSDDRQGGLMRPVSFQRDCSYCHSLYFDPLVDVQVPHDTTEVVHRFVDLELRRFIEANPDQVTRVEPVRGRIPVNFPELEATAAPPARNADEWVRRRQAAVEDRLWTRTCAECHLMTRSSDAILQTVPTAAPASWMPRARFDHRSHQLATCESCHHTAAASTETADVLMPPIATCQQCHNDSRRAADARCFVCHEYHDWKQPTTATPAGFPISGLQ